MFGVVPGWWSLAGSGLILGSAIFVAMSMGNGDVGVAKVGDEELGDATAEEQSGMLSGSGSESESGIDNEDMDEAGTGEVVQLRDFSAPSIPPSPPRSSP